MQSSARGHSVSNLIIKRKLTMRCFVISFHEMEFSFSGRHVRWFEVLVVISTTLIAKLRCFFFHYDWIFACYNSKLSLSFSTVWIEKQHIFPFLCPCAWWSFTLPELRTRMWLLCDRVKLLCLVYSLWFNFLA